MSDYTYTARKVYLRTTSTKVDSGEFVAIFRDDRVDRAAIINHGAPTLIAIKNRIPTGACLSVGRKIEEFIKYDWLPENYQELIDNV